MQFISAQVNVDALKLSLKRQQLFHGKDRWNRYLSARARKTMLFRNELFVTSRLVKLAKYTICKVENMSRHEVRHKHI